jgi:hypothetical protein
MVTVCAAERIPAFMPDTGNKSGGAQCPSRPRAGVCRIQERSVFPQRRTNLPLGSLYVLDLLAHLLDQYFHFHRRARGICIL